MLQVTLMPSLTSAKFYSCHHGHGLSWWLCCYFSRKLHNSCLTLLAVTLVYTGNRHQIPLMWGRFKGDPVLSCIKFRQLCLCSEGILEWFARGSTQSVTLRINIVYNLHPPDWGWIDLEAKLPSRSFCTASLSSEELRFHSQWWK